MNGAGLENARLSRKFPLRVLLEPLKKPFIKQRKTLVLTIMAGWGKFIIPLYIPYVAGKVIDGIIDPWFAGGMSIEEAAPALHFYAWSALVAIAITGVAAYFRTALSLRMAAKIQHGLRHRLFHHVQKLSMSFFQKHHSGSLGSRVSSDINYAGNLINQVIVQYSMDGVTSALLMAMLFLLNWQLALVMLASIPIIFLFMRHYIPKLRDLQRSVQEGQGRITGRAAEIFAGISLVKASGGERESAQVFLEQSEEVRNLQFKNATLTSIFHAFTHANILFISWSVLFLGAFLILYAPGSLTKGEIVAFLLYVGHVTGPIQRMMDSMAILQEGVAALERIADILHVAPDPPESKNVIVPPLSGRVEFQGVHFAYMEKPVIRDFSFAFEKGKTYALVGPSGSGKSSLCQLMLRFYDPSQGRILVDGHDLKDVRIEHYRKHVAVVLQDPVMFSTTIANNIGFAMENPSRGAIINAAREAQAYDFIMSLPDGFETRLDERGVNLSGGQRQRIAIARAIIRDPKLLILDEATSALDPITESCIKDVIDGLRSTRTVVIIAHRLSTIRNVDEIVVLREGAIAEHGSYRSLLEKGALFSQLVSEQTSLQNSLAFQDSKKA